MTEKKCKSCGKGLWPSIDGWAPEDFTAEIERLRFQLSVAEKAALMERHEVEAWREYFPALGYDGKGIVASG